MSWSLLHTQVVSWFGVSAFLLYSSLKVSTLYYHIFPRFTIHINLLGSWSFKQNMFSFFRYDPDILLGYEVQMHSWGYLLQRAAALDVDLCQMISRVPGLFLTLSLLWGAVALFPCLFVKATTIIIIVPHFTPCLKSEYSYECCLSSKLVNYQQGSFHVIGATTCIGHFARSYGKYTLDSIYHIVWILSCQWQNGARKDILGSW